ncbi:transcription initiation factor TFIIE subunit alpha [Methanococcus voltae]|uniref:Transcription factor E n=2 Tax=Methanococcus voltae TaxID=2188 RepID=A0A8J7RF91_METVO|nr:transcription factor E [Methanococcus voltae]MBP2144513.1 transcription initiation factor TFIIE subunit alpha [Methanococcus voltae]MBP2173248.1 transcription initiation factor TFIIE subunit alpha [Methanococcus voltae]MBP2202112.1 transcription initiation factor TFIIE subunit alpha [Methanococcus voltae]MCS3922925.1 transcription initiation factor TFIIE subunit alpha [Methanococcus voltae PS]
MKYDKDDMYVMLENPLVQQVLFEVMDEDMMGFDVLSILIDLGEVTDDEISRQLDVKLNNIRKILYRLYEARLVNYNREKDEETNWYTYTWMPALEKLPGLVKKKMEKLISTLKDQLSMEEDNLFFYCQECEIKFTFEDAMDNCFKCPQCDGTLYEYDNNEDISNIKNQINYLEKEYTLNSLFS